MEVSGTSPASIPSISRMTGVSNMSRLQRLEACLYSFGVGEKRGQTVLTTRHGFWWVRWRDVAWLSRGGGLLPTAFRSLSSFGFARALEALGQAARGVVDTRNLDFGRAHPVGDDVGRFGYHEFTRAGDAAGRAKFRVFREQVFYAIEDVQGDALCGGQSYSAMCARKAIRS